MPPEELGALHEETLWVLASQFDDGRVATSDQWASAVHTEVLMAYGLAFREHVAQLKARERALRQAHDEMERRVVERTQELTREVREHKIGALDQAAPLAGWELPDAFPTLRRLLEARMGKAGKREYVQVLRLVETFDLEVLHGAVKDALRLGAIGYDAVKHLVLCRIERRPPKLDLDIYPYLPRANVATTAAASYTNGINYRPVWAQSLNPMDMIVSG